MNDFILCSTNKFKASDFQAAIASKSSQAKNDIANAIELRLLERYILPSEGMENKNGFNIMAVNCLLIETIQSFYNGHDKTPRGDRTFEDFFKRENQFKDISNNNLGHQIYKNIRNGILHQGETTGGWRIRRDLTMMIDVKNKIIDANHFREAMKMSVIGYSKKLKQSEWSSTLWQNCISKMESIIKNCQ